MCRTAGIFVVGVPVGVFLCVRALTAGSAPEAPRAGVERLAELAPGWRGEIVATVDQSYVGWDVEIGDADNDGRNGILATGCANSRLDLFKKVNGAWQARTLAENLAREVPGMGLTVRVVNLNADGRNEIVLGTGQEAIRPAHLYVLQTDGTRLTRTISCQTGNARSHYTHNLGVHDVDGDGLGEVIAAYCLAGEVLRYDVDKDLTKIDRQKIYECSGSGEDSLIADVDNDGKVEYIVCDSYRDAKAKVRIFEFSEKGNLLIHPHVVIPGFLGENYFNCGVEVGDVDNDGRKELIVGWKRKEDFHAGTIAAFRVDGKHATPVYTFAFEDTDLDLGFFEKMMCVADADNDGKNELVVTTRGERRWGGRGLGHVFMYKVRGPRKITKTLLVNFRDGKANSCWPAVGDADNDGKNEIVITTGAGDRTKPGTSHVVLLEKE